MKTIRKFLILLVLAMMVSLAASSQSYKTGVGLRGGWTPGITVKHFISGTSALEGLLSTRYNGFLLTGLYEVHAPAFGVTGLYWYYGGGAHIGAWNRYYRTDKADNYSVIGIDGILGMEFNITEIPFNLSIDYKPGINLLGKPFGLTDEVALSVRYVFGYR
jgi:hypothetical protein